jgi:predicted membrane protein DUF2232
MTRNLIAGIAAGLVSLVMLISATTGVVLMQFLLVVATPLPIYLVGLALGWTTAAVAAVTGVLAFATLAGPLAALVAAGTHFGPPVLLTYLAMLNRTVQAPDGTTNTQWYPVGRLVLWCAAIGAVLSIALLARLGGDSAGTQEMVRSLVEQVLAQQAGGEEIPEEHIAAMTRILSALLPVLSGVGMTAIVAFQFWLASYVAKASGNLQRPWPEISAMTFPTGASLVLVACILLSMVLTDLPGSAASAAFGAFFLAFIMLGLAVIHYVTRTNPWRFALLWAVYFGLIMFSTGFSVLIAVIGITEPISPLRRDFMRPPPPQGPKPPD